MAGIPQWLEWARKLQAIAQTGLTYAQDPFDIERYKAVRETACEILADSGNLPIEQASTLFGFDQGYATPKVGVRGAVFCEGGLLLVRERSDQGWALPGGWTDVGQSASECVEREVFEESGYHVRAVKLLAVYDRNRHPHPPTPYHAYKIFFRCELLGGTPTSSLETDGAAFFKEHEIPELSVARTTPNQIARLFEHYSHPEWPADFD